MPASAITILIRLANQKCNYLVLSCVQRSARRVYSDRFINYLLSAEHVCQPFTFYTLYMYDLARCLYVFLLSHDIFI